MFHQFEKAVLMKEYAETKQEEKKERKQSWRVNINNLALALFMLVNMINSQHFYTDVKALKTLLLCYQLLKDIMMLWRFKNNWHQQSCISFAYAH